jgi:hypothetical protein
VNDIFAAWHSDCQPEGFIRFGERFTSFALSAGKFGDAWDQSFADSEGGKLNYAYTIDGKVRRRSANGTLHVGVTQTDSAGATTATCDTGPVTWKATTG